MSRYNYDEQGSLMNVEKDVCQQVPLRQSVVGGGGGQGTDLRGTENTSPIGRICVFTDAFDLW